MWPARSPDLNPIEHVWNWTDNKLSEIQVTSKTDLAKHLAEIWNQVETEFCQNLIGSMRKRCAKCILTKGGHFSY